MRNFKNFDNITEARDAYIWDTKPKTLEDAEEWNELVTFVSERWDLDTEDGDDDLSQKIEEGLNAGIELIRMTQLFKV